jgi:hypothetical protein
MVDQSQEEGNQAEPRVRLLRNEDNTADGIVDDLLGAGPPTTPGAGYGNGHFHWLYLRRPADPHRPVQNDPTAADYNPFVVVDSMRFAYVESGGTGQMVNGQPQTVQGAQEIYSYQRFQPYRGGHAVPNRSDGLSATYSPANAYGYSEQIEATRDDDPDDPEEWYGLFEPTLPPDANNRVTRNIRHTLGEGSDRDPDPNDIGEDDDDWDGFVFFDRDFQSVAELLMVPVNPPGLFTKHFVEKQPEVSPNIPQSPGGMPPDIWIPPAPHANADGTFPYKAPPPTEPAVDEETGDDLPDDEPHSYPYLSDNFFYSGEGQDTADNATTATPPGTGPVAGGHTGAGWHRMLGFFEVPSSAVGAIGPLAKGVNRDWYREDVRPGQINLNLIVDEEVFFGLVDDPRMYYSNFNAPIQPPDLEVVTQADPATGNPTATVDLDTSRGFFYNDPAATPPGVPAPPATDFGANNGFMKPAFRDFLFNRHGNSGFLFGSLPPPVSPPAPVGTVYTERPFHDITYPDIFYTLFRPAATQENGTYVFPDDPADATDDPVGIKPYRDPTTTPLQPPAIHPRRLFEVPSQAFLAGPTAELNLFDQIAVTTPMPGPGPRYYLGNNGNNDFRRHPYFRTQLLQKLMNLSTVRTHQYAVWVTVGYFEVVQEGDPAKAVYNPDLAVDKLGREIGRDEGTAVRHRSFFILDRTRATGFSPANPVDFRDVVRYRRRIE